MDNSLLIIDDIKIGNNWETLSGKYNKTYRQLHRLSLKFGVLDIFKKNNTNIKIEKMHLAKNVRHAEINDSIHKKYGKQIIDDICINKFTISDIKRKYKLPSKQINRYLDSINYKHVAATNGKKKVSEFAKINGKKSAIQLKGKELKPITPEIVGRFKELKRSLKYKEKVYVALKTEFGFGSKKAKQLCEKYGYPEDNPQTGNLNPMYGKSPSVKSGIGVKCHIVINGNLYFCRSTLELKIFLYLRDNNIKFIPSKHRVKYKYKDKERTYLPDIVLEDQNVCEIKPAALVNLDLNLIKMNALQTYCDMNSLSCRFITENDYDLTVYSDIHVYDKLINSGELIIDSINYEKLKRNI